MSSVIYKPLSWKGHVGKVHWHLKQTSLMEFELYMYRDNSDEKICTKFSVSSIRNTILVYMPEDFRRNMDKLLKSAIDIMERDYTIEQKQSALERVIKTSELMK